MTHEIREIYAIHESTIYEAVIEIAVSHVEWLDIQLTVERPPTLVLTPTTVFMTTSSGLTPVRRESDIWDILPKVVDVFDENDRPHFVDNASAQEVFNYLINRIKETCPDWKFLERRERR